MWFAIPPGPPPEDERPVKLICRFCQRGDAESDPVEMREGGPSHCSCWKFARECGEA